MARPTLTAGVTTLPGGGFRVESPGVGVWVDPPLPGGWLGPGGVLGSWERLNRRWTLVLPGDVTGVVVGDARGRRTAMGFGDVLFTLAPLRGIEIPAAPAAATPAGLPEGTRALVAPTEGVFYRSPDPASPPFVVVGGRVRRGQPIGLIEVMKTFNQVLYDGDVPDEAEVVDVRHDSGEEVKAGAVLLVVR